LQRGPIRMEHDFFIIDGHVYVTQLIFAHM